MRASPSGLIARLLLVTGLAAVIAALPAEGQSLGDLAKQEQARRKSITQSGKVLTNDSIKSVPPRAAATPPAPSAAPAAGASESAPAASVKPAAPSDPKAEETRWRKRMQDARDALQRSQMFADALQSQINGLTADFTARDDPAQRAVVGDNRQKALAELDRVKNDIVQQTKAIAGIQEEARRAGVPPGWLR